MKQPWVYMCSPSRSPLPPPSLKDKEDHIISWAQKPPLTLTLTLRVECRLLAVVYEAMPQLALGNLSRLNPTYCSILLQLLVLPQAEHVGSYLRVSALAVSTPGTRLLTSLRSLPNVTPSERHPLPASSDRAIPVTHLVLTTNSICQQVSPLICPLSVFLTQ